jgi:predicted metal-dependent HD superfamily phosphohydrolase
MKLASSVISSMIEYFEGDANRIGHSLKVYGFAKSIGELEALNDEKMTVLEIAAILHDIGIRESERKYSSAAARYQEQEGPPAARGILKESGLSGEQLERVCYIIGNHHTYGKIDDVDFQILVEADFLVNIHEGKMEKEQIKSIRKNYFKTGTGLHYLDSMFITY